MGASPNFWTFDRLWMFYQCVQDALRKEDQTEWIAYVDNPLLFALRLSHFFTKMSKSLNVDSKEIQTLCDDLVKMCVKYIETSSEENLLLNFFEIDKWSGYDFFDLTFDLQCMDIVENSFVTKVIQNMWAIGHSSR